MSIENNIKRLADAAETIAQLLANPQHVAAPGGPAPGGPAPGGPAPGGPAPGGPAPGGPGPGPAVTTGKTPEEMNNILVAEFKRIGNRTPIDQAMAAHGITSVASLTVEQQNQIIAAVAAIPAAG